MSTCDDDPILELKSFSEFSLLSHNSHKENRNLNPILVEISSQENEPIENIPSNDLSLHFCLKLFVMIFSPAIQKVLIIHCDVFFCCFFLKIIQNANKFFRVMYLMRACSN